MTRKTEMIHIRLTENEKKSFKLLAEKIGEAPSRLIRKFLREAINTEPDLLTDEAALLKIAIRQLIGVANNLNQITTAINAGINKSYVDEKYLLELKAHVTNVKEALKASILKSKNRWVKDYGQ